MSAATDAEDMFEDGPCGYLGAEPDGTVISANRTVLRWLGVDESQVLGSRIVDFLAAGSRIHFETHFLPLLHTRGEFEGVAVELRAPSGERLPVFLSANIRRHADGTPAFFRFSMTAATERRSYERELLDERRRAEEALERVQVLATTLQRSLLPPVLLPPGGLDAHAYYHFSSTHDVGGDFYDLFPLPDERWGFFLGDVCGKGPDAAVITSSTRYALRAASVYDYDPVSVLHNLNSVLLQEFGQEESRFCTVIFGILSRDDDGFVVEFASGGHPPPLVLRANGTAHYQETSGGQLVGILPDAQFVPARVRLNPGDTFVLYTDGLTEARTGNGRQRYDDDGALERHVSRHAPASASEIVAALRELLSSFGPGLEDDCAIMAFGVPGGRPQDGCAT